MIGNDIVDMADTSCHPGFAKRIMTSLELGRWQNLESEKEQKLYLWQTWAGKEAAFKALRRTWPECRAIASHFECSPDFNTVSHREKPSPLQLSMEIQESAFVLAVCRNRSDLFTVSTRILQSPGESWTWQEESQIARDLAHNILKNKPNWPDKLWIFSKNPVTSVPSMLSRNSDGDQIEIPCSISHHGRFCAVSLAMPHQPGGFAIHAPPELSPRHLSLA